MDFKLFTTFIYHVSVFLMYLITFIKISYIEIPYEHEHHKFGGVFKYITQWCNIIQVIYFGLATYIDFHSPLVRMRGGLLQCRDVMFASLTFPAALTICLLFTILFLINPALLSPNAQKIEFPFWLNLIVHAAIVPTALIEVFLTKHVYPKRQEGIRNLILVASAYVLWIAYLFHKDIYVYGMFKYMNCADKFVFLSVCIMSMPLIYQICEKIHKLRWGN